MVGQVVGFERNADSRMAKHYQDQVHSVHYAICLTQHAAQVLSGDREQWDLSLLCFAFLNSSHELMRGAISTFISSYL